VGSGLCLVLFVGTLVQVEQLQAIQVKRKTRAFVVPFSNVVRRIRMVDDINQEALCRSFRGGIKVPECVDFAVNSIPWTMCFSENLALSPSSACS
jgi:hypothetical protein